ncbi:hypothetical protein BJX65DRAFT_310768 [Aspergillus insuetus]
MPHAQRTIKLSRVNLIQSLKENVGPEALKTLNPERAASKRLEPEVGSSISSSASKSESATRSRAGKRTRSSTLLPWSRDTRSRRWLALLTANKLNEAAENWNALNLGVKFAWVEKIENAAFLLSFAKQRSPGTLAEAFFPNDVDLNSLIVYPAAFQPGYVQYLKNIFLHELGHVLGLRHKFAPELEKGVGLDSVQVGPRNPTSVMGYEFPPLLQTSNVDNTKVFYRFPGKNLGVRQNLPVEWGLRIVDFEANN